MSRIIISLVTAASAAIWLLMTPSAALAAGLPQGPYDLHGQTTSPGFTTFPAGDGQGPNGGWWVPSGNTTIYGPDSSGLEINWTSSYVYPYGGGQVPVYWLVDIGYANVGNPDPNGSDQILYFDCNGWADPSNVVETMAGTPNAGAVHADSTMCSRNPDFVANLAPGRSFESWAIFHNVPWQGSTVQLTWGNDGQTQAVNPWLNGAWNPTTTFAATGGTTGLPQP